MSFGRKGLAPGQSGAAAPAIRARAPQPARPAAAPADPYAAQREAFLAAERARAAAGSGGAYDPAETTAPYPRRDRSPGSRSVFGDPNDRSLLLAYVFWNFCAPLGMHRFYCGATESAWYQMALFFGGLVSLLIFPPMGVALLGAWFLWVLADLFLIPGMMRRLKAARRSEYTELFA